jgi:hypothetical protein
MDMALEEPRRVRPHWLRWSGQPADRSPRLADDARARERARSVFQALGARGLRSEEAGNLTAFLLGLRPAAGGWSIAEIEQLLSLRSLVRRGVVSP